MASFIDLITRTRSDLALVEAIRGGARPYTLGYTLTTKELASLEAGDEELARLMWYKQISAENGNLDTTLVELTTNPPPPENAPHLNISLPDTIPTIVPVLQELGPTPERVFPPDNYLPPPEHYPPDRTHSFDRGGLPPTDELVRKFQDSAASDGFDAALALIEGILHDRRSARYERI